jgi:hypothetical protein
MSEKEVIIRLIKEELTDVSEDELNISDEVVVTEKGRNIIIYNST